MTQAETLAPGLRVLTAPNPGPMTATGTRSYLLGRRRLAVVDPGPDDAGHVAALLQAANGAEITHILVTHAHRDHSGAVPALARETGATVLAFGPASAGRSPSMAALAGRPGLGGGEGVDADFVPDRALEHGERVEGGDWAVTALHTPGHLSSHLCFVLEGPGAILTGDTVMGWASTLISPPDGSVGAFLASMELLEAREEELYLPGHGPPIARGRAEAARLRAHRLERSAQVTAALREGVRTVPQITRRLYADTPPALHGAAARNVLAHLVDLAEQGRVVLPDGPLDSGEFRLC